MTRKKKPAKTPLEKLVTRYKTRRRNLIDKLEALKTAHDAEAAKLRKELDEIAEILRKLDR